MGINNQNLLAEERNLVSIEIVRDVRPIPGARMVEAITVKGWTIVTKIGEFKAGDSCLYFEIDSLLPISDPRFAFLRERGVKEVNGVEYHHLKTARLQKIYSQGLALPLELFPEVSSEETSLALLLGVINYEPETRMAGSDIVGSFPSRLGQKTKSERVQNLVENWEEIISNGPWIATEKIDGTSISVFKDLDGKLFVCSHNFEVSQNDSIYGQTVQAYGVDRWLEPGWGFQGELFGENINKNPLGVSGRKIAIFDIIESGNVQSYYNWPEEALKLRVPLLDLELPKTVGEAIAQVDKLKSKIATERGAEGVVWHQADGKGLGCLNNRTTFKVISNSYLLKHE
jgi:RNA ligase (TIGR02306 family)